MDRTTIINRALIKLGVQTISAETDQVEQARKALAVFNSLAQSELRKQMWTFAIKRVALAANVAAPVFGYTYAYDNPTDCLRIITVGEVYIFNLGRAYSTDDSPYWPEGKQLLTNDAGPLKIRYVQDLSLSSAKWDPCFCEAFACALAFELTYTLAKVASKRNDMAADYLKAIKDARRCNAIEVPPQNYAEEGWNISRMAP